MLYSVSEYQVQQNMAYILTNIETYLIIKNKEQERQHVTYNNMLWYGRLRIIFKLHHMH